MDSACQDFVGHHLGVLSLGQRIMFDCGRPNTLEGTDGTWAAAPQGFGAALQQVLLRHDDLLRGLAAAPPAAGQRDGPAMTVLRVVAATQGVRRELLTLASLCSGSSYSGMCTASRPSLLCTPLIATDCGVLMWALW